MKEKKSVLVASLAGIVACLLCVGMIFLYPTKEKDLKNNEVTPNEVIPNDEEILLGDTCGSWNWGEPVCTTATTNNHGTPPGSCPAYDQEMTSYCKAEITGSDNTGPIYDTLNCTRTRTCASYSSCSAGKYLTQGRCETCPEGYTSDDGATMINQCYLIVSAGKYVKTANQPQENCPAGTFSTGGNKIYLGSTTECTPCAKGYYNTAAGSGGCSKCPDGTTTESTGSVGENSCRAEAVPITAISVTCTATSLVQGASTTCTATVTPNNTTETVYWSSLRENVATVNNGTVTAVAPGTTTITARNPSGNIKDTVTITVTQPTCSQPNTYWNGTECKYCPDAYKATIEHPECHMEIPAGSYKVPGSSTTIETCRAGSYSTGGIYYLNGGEGSSALTSCTSCGANMTSPIGATSASQCTPRTSESDCTVTITSSVAPNGLVSYGSHFTANIKVTGNGCDGQTLTTRITQGGTLSNGNKERTDNVSNGSEFNFIVDVTGNACRNITMVDGILSGAGTTPGHLSVNTTCEWPVSPRWTDCVPSSQPDYLSKKEAEDAGENHYYIIKDNNICKSGERYVDYYVRSCCGGVNPPSDVKYDFCCAKDDGTAYSWSTNQTSRTCPSGYHIDDSKDATTCTNRVPIPACYKDSDNNYHWSTDVEASPSWEKVAGITKEEMCKAEETPACYIDKNGVYDWGNHATDDGYTLVPSIKEATLCREPASEEACYKNDSDDYVWAETAPEGYTKVDEITNPKDCHPTEEPACYVHGQEFVWGNYKNVIGYIILDGIDSEDKCVVPKTEACYENPNGDYEWGDFSDDDDYKLIPSVTDINDCNNDVPTPKTGIDASKVMYIFMAILMLFGIGFIYYSTVARKQNQ